MPVPALLGAYMRRREFLGVLAGAPAVPFTDTFEARAQQATVRRIAVLMPYAADEPDVQPRLAAFHQGLQETGWTIGRNVTVAYRWGAGDDVRIRKYAAELIALHPDVILATGGSTTGPLQRATRTVPIVFAQVPDPVGAGFVESLARPGGNITGFTSFEYSLSIKWLELLKQVAPHVTRVAVLRDATNPSGTGQFGAIQGVSQAFGVELRPINLRDLGEIERSISAFARLTNGGVIVTANALAISRREQIAAIMARYNLPAVYPYRLMAAAGGLLSYGADTVETYRAAAAYVARILKGESPADLPVQASTKYEMVINLKTAKTLGLTVPPTLLARADEVIE
jgi:putative ABC transport system substrate-binding protein